MPLTKVASSMLASGASGSGGSAGKNYISSYNENPCNGDFESGSVNGWVSCQVSSITNGLPSGLTLNAGTVTRTLAPAAIAGQYSLQTVFPATADQGFITEAFTIDTQDQAKVLTFTFYYQVTAGASNGNFSGTSANTFIVGIYAVNGSNAGWLQPAGVYSMTQSSGAGIATGTFQTYSDTTQYRFAILCETAPSNPITITFDDFSVSPQTAPIGTVATDWISYTPTLKGTGGDPNIGTGSIVGRWRRVGDSLQVQCEVTAGTGALSGTGNYYFTLPTGLVIDTAKIALISGSESITSFGSAAIFNASVASNVGFPIVLSGLTNGLGISNGGSAVGRDSPAATWWSSGDALQINAQVPIQGWSSNVQLSSDTDTRVVAASYNFPSTAVAANTDIANIWTRLFDTHSAFTNSTGRYVASVSGIYRVSFISTKATTGNSIFVFRNGSSYTGLFSYAIAGGISSGSTTVSLNAGDYITFQANGAITIDGSFSVERISGPSVVAASETVAMTYTGTATGTLTTGGTNFLATVPTKVFDTHNAYASGLFTVPVSGKYQVYAQLQINAIFASGTTTARCEIRQSGSASTSIIGLQGWTSGASSNPTRPNTSIILNCVAGDTIAVYGGSDGGTLSYGNQCSVSIERVGN